LLTTTSLHRRSSPGCRRISRGTPALRLGGHVRTRPEPQAANGREGAR
jgi:hypothetical protein